MSDEASTYNRRQGVRQAGSVDQVPRNGAAVSSYQYGGGLPLDF